MTKKINKQIKLLGMIFVGLFIAMAVNIAVFIEKDSFSAINNTYNKRSDILEQEVHRGNIYAEDSTVLATTIDNEDGTYTRYYPYDNIYCHVVGSYDMGKTGIELYENYTMLQYNDNLADIVKSDVSGEKIQGHSIYTTLDTKIQNICYEALGDNKGAVIVLEPSTGKILAMVSKPDYNPNTIKENWESINTADVENSKLINRATQGLYAPGSTFKIVTLLEYIREYQNDYENYSYVCRGTDSFNNAKISCYANHKHGTVNLRQSLALSCNCSFANMGVNIAATGFMDTVDKLCFSKLTNINDFTVSKSSFYLSKDANEEDKVQASIGQGTTLVTPLQNLMIASAVANDGVAMTPYVVDKVVSNNGSIIKQTDPEVLAQYMTKDESKILAQYMTEVCETGTADELSAFSYECAGKTGSAEFSSNDESHAWFIGFAPANAPQIAVSIIVEGAGTGSKYAVPIAAKIFEAYLGK